MMYDERNKTAKRLLQLAFCLRMFLSGVEYSVILPSVIPYIKMLKGDNFLVGLSVGVYPFSAMLTLPLFGYLYDKTKQLRALLILSNAIQMVGNLVYALPYSKYMPFVGRFIAGIGDGFMACSVGEITLIYAKDSRIGVLALMELTRVIGVMFGPTLNLFFARNSYMAGDWKLDYRTLPGVAMAGAWLVMCLLTLVLVEDVARKRECDREESVEFIEQSSDSCNLFNEEEKAPTKTSYWISVRDAVFSREFIIIMYVDFVLWFVQTQCEILLPFVTETEFGWTPAVSSYIYIGGGVILLLVFAAIYFLCPKYPVHDAYLILFALAATQLALLLMTLQSVPRGKDAQIGLFMMMAVLEFLSIPFNLVCARNLFTKLFPGSSQGIIQGIFASASRISLIGGPVLMSLLFKHRTVYGVCASVACLIAIFLFFTSIPRIKQRERQMEIKLTE